MDLSCLKGRTITAHDTTDHTYTYTLCANEAGSCAGGDALMTKQVNDEDSTQCFEIGRWNPEINPIYDDTTGWQFEYQNGEGGCLGDLTRTWVPTFVCDSGTELSWDGVTEQFGACRYLIDIRTKFACPGTPCELDEGGISGGWIFIIILVCGFFAYFCIGYIVMAVTVNKEGGFGDFNNNIPNRAFWSKLPALVIAGCAVTKDSVLGLVNKGGTSGADDTPLTES